MYQLVQDFQDLIAGLIGFGGVIASIFVSFWLGRRQRRQDREAEAAALRQALRVEFEIIRDQIARSIAHGRADADAGANGDGALIPKNFFRPVYDKLMEKILTIDAHEVQAVLSAYLSLNDYERTLHTLFETNEAGTHFVAPRHHVAAHLDLLERLAPKIDAALSSIG